MSQLWYQEMRGGRNAGLNTQLGFSFSFGTPPRHLSEGKKDYFILGHHFIPTGLQLFFFFNLSFIFSCFSFYGTFHFLHSFHCHSLTLAFPINRSGDWMKVRLRFRPLSPKSNCANIQFSIPDFLAEGVHGPNWLNCTRWQMSRDMTVKLLKPHPARYDAQEGWGSPRHFNYLATHCARCGWGSEK